MLCILPWRTVSLRGSSLYAHSNLTKITCQISVLAFHYLTSQSITFPSLTLLIRHKGAMLSGIRAAKEVLSTMKCSSGSTARESKDVDRIIPVSLFRHNNPNAPLRCSFCHKIGSQVREGSLLAFKRGAREVLAHDNCAEYSPEVEVR